jgi:hypothetical protein
VVPIGLPTAEFQPVATGASGVDDVKQIPEGLPPPSVAILTPEREKTERLLHRFPEVLGMRTAGVLRFALRALKRVQRLPPADISVTYSSREHRHTHR